MKRCAIIPFKHGMRELSHELPNDLRSYKMRKFRKLSKLHRMIAFPAARYSSRKTKLAPNIPNNTHTHTHARTHTHTHRANTKHPEKNNIERVSMKIGPFIFKTTLPILPTYPSLWQKNELPPFIRKFRKLNLPIKYG